MRFVFLVVLVCAALAGCGESVSGDSRVNAVAEFCEGGGREGEMLNARNEFLADYQRGVASEEDAETLYEILEGCDADSAEVVQSVMVNVEMQK